MSTTVWPPEPSPWDSSQGDLTREQGVYPSQLEQKPEGYAAMPMDTPDQMRALGWWECPTKKDSKGRPCGFWLSPQAKSQIENGSGYFTCPKCLHTYDLLEELPWHGVDDPEVFGEDFTAGGGTRIGIPLIDQGQIGENLVAHMGEIPGYGPITWWHPGGAGAKSPLDGTTKEWGIEVKTLGYDAMHHRFAPGGEGNYFEEKNQAAREMGVKGVLGVLVLLDYRRDVADIYVKAMPLEPWEFHPGRFTHGVAQFRKNTATKLVSEVPFVSPYKDPASPTPVTYRASDYYNAPQAQMPPQLQQPESEPAPF